MQPGESTKTTHSSSHQAIQPPHPPPPSLVLLALPPSYALAFPNEDGAVSLKHTALHVRSSSSSFISLNKKKKKKKKKSFNLQVKEMARRPQETIRLIRDATSAVINK